MIAISIFDETFDALPRAAMYRGWTMPDVFRGQRQPVLSNWHPEDLAPYCGGEYAKHAYAVPVG